MTGTAMIDASLDIRPLLDLDALDELDPSDFQRLAEQIKRHAGIKMPVSKRGMAEGRLRKRVRALGLPSIRQYCKMLFEAGALADELPHLIDVMTTNKTDFFREPNHFEILANLIVPSLIARRREPQPRLKVWSAASSTGAEAYTIAMVLADLAGGRGDFGFFVLGTDICSTVLETASRAVYPVPMIAPVPPAMRTRYLMRGRDGSADVVRIAPGLRRHVRFARMNLIAETYPIDGDIDVIFLRNVLIYFDADTQAAVIRRMIGRLRPGGFLLIGHSETMPRDITTVRQRAPAVFEKL